jgi:hypothetical protein
MAPRVQMKVIFSRQFKQDSAVILYLFVNSNGGRPTRSVTLLGSKRWEYADRGTPLGEGDINESGELVGFPVEDVKGVGACIESARDVEVWIDGKKVYECMDL